MSRGLNDAAKEFFVYYTGAGVETDLNTLMLTLYEAGLAAGTADSVDINGGAVDDTIIGGTTPAAGTFTNALATGTLGYAAGAGGAVTQLTSRTTGVTLNKSSGAITLVSDAGSASWATFTVTNSVVGATDVVLVSQKSGTDKYMVHVTAVGAGSFDITFATTGGTTTEQPVFNFVVLQGVAA
jgi:hypothetical protein